MEGEGALMYDCALAMRDIMLETGMAIDGGKDSLSMAATADGEVVKGPGTLVVSATMTLLTPSSPPPHPLLTPSSPLLGILDVHNVGN
eukprot:876436-Prorocentrum_minimum.AAC.1